MKPIRMVGKKRKIIKTKPKSDTIAKGDYNRNHSKLSKTCRLQSQFQSTVALRRQVQTRPMKVECKSSSKKPGMQSLR
jgi:hypothetical protein